MSLAFRGGRCENFDLSGTENILSEALTPWARRMIPLPGSTI